MPGRCLADARYEISQWRTHYNHVRPYSSLGDLPLVAYAQQCACRGGFSHWSRT
ncbi:integrase core domain-containing protein [Billgrantia sp. Q4P2]|uniref:integrase core domain-containing protein n=1 Tax=Billgrantia sp. Q4P2 TaxID=3463857 RepID=UPI004057862A